MLGNIVAINVFKPLFGADILLKLPAVGTVPVSLQIEVMSGKQISGIIAAHGNFYLRSV